ncbi:polyadenylate-binding protein RBP45B [Tanacetum coccineum]
MWVHRRFSESVELSVESLQDLKEFDFELQNIITSLALVQDPSPDEHMVAFMGADEQLLFWRVFTGDLDPNVIGKHLHQVFRQYGQLVHAKIHAGKQCGFVQLAERHCDEEALRIL